MFSKQMRSTLKEQMEDKAQAEKNEQEMKVHESRIAIEIDRQDQEQLRQKRLERARLLLQATTRNKEVRQTTRSTCKHNCFLLLVDAAQMGVRSMESSTSMACGTRYSRR